MAWTTPGHSRTAVDAAAEFLVRGTKATGAWDRAKIIDAFDKVNNWRSSHSWPLLSIRLSLTDRARKLHAKALIAQRLKRLPAIFGKLHRFSHMKLSQMQDIGGCRAVMPQVAHVERLDMAYTRAATRRMKHQPECIERYDYIKQPKSDGYRGIHLVYKYHSRLEKYANHDGLRIEIQLRSRLQHEWATAVETVDLFTQQALKSSIGKREWKRFFLLVGTLFAKNERRPLPSGAPRNRRSLRAELRQLAIDLRVETVFWGWSAVLKEFLPKRMANASTFLLKLDVDSGVLTAKQYSMAEHAEANEDYLNVEKEIFGGRIGLHAVLVSVQSLQALRQAYPSFYADTDLFLRHLRAEIGDTGREINQSG